MQIGHVGDVAASFPALEGNAEAMKFRQDCDVFFQKGIKDATAGTYDESSITAAMGSLPAHQLELYQVCYRAGRYSEMNVTAANRDAFAGETGRAVAYGFDDALAGRPRDSVYIPSNSALWNQTDLSVMDNAYVASYNQGYDLAHPSRTGTWILAGLAVLAGVGGVMYWQARKSSAVHPLDKEVYANPALGEYERKQLEEEFMRLDGQVVALSEKFEDKYGHDWLRRTSKAEDEKLDRLYGKMQRILDALGWGDWMRKVNPSRAPGMSVQSLLFSRQDWDRRSAKSWAKSHGYRSDSVDVKPNTIRLRQRDPSSFRRGTMRTIEFGDGYGIKAVVAKPKR